MNLVPNEFYHIYNRGNNKQKIFFKNDNYIFFLKKVRDQLVPVSDILSWCLMPNHFHFIVRATDKSIMERPSFGGKPMQEFPYRVGILLSSYSQAINKQNNTTGSLFQQKTKAKILCEEFEGKKESYLLNCFFYLNRNPLKSGLIDDLTKWPWSSYPDYIGLRNGSLCNKELFFSLFHLSTDDIIARSQTDPDDDMIEKFY